MRLHGRHWLALAVTATLMAGAIDADAQNRLRRTFGRNARAQQARQYRQQQGQFKHRFKQFVQTNRLKSFKKHGKPVVATMRKTNMKQYLNLGKNVVELFVKPGFHHLYARVPMKGKNGKVKHKVFSRISGLSTSKWYKGSSERVSVLVELSDSEMTNLRDFLTRAEKRPREVLGPFEYAGGTPPRCSNCTSYLTTAKVGNNGESFARLLGVGESGMPQGFLKNLMRRGNDKVKAVVVQNPSKEFSASYDLDAALR